MARRLSKVPNDKVRKLTRAERAAENRAKLIHAAQEVIGEMGYAEASIARIVERAGLAQGTFYLYFESRQDLFDKLLPEAGDEALAFIGKAVKGSPDFVAMEEKGLHAFFEYATQNPSYFRVLSEAEIAAPAAYLGYTRKRTNGFLSVVKAAWKKGEIAGYSERELGVLTQLMLAARAYLFQEYARTSNGVRKPPPWVVDTYIKFLLHGLAGPSPKPRKAVARRTR
jgi:AcrR family transcriptional regulator